MTHRPRTIDPLTRTSAWLADIDDWDASDADVFVVAANGAAGFDTRPVAATHPAGEPGQQRSA